MTLRIPNAQFTRWYIGVYGFSTCTYFISVSSSSTYTPIAPARMPDIYVTDQCATCVHGSCTPEGVCACSSGWAGQYCDIGNIFSPLLEKVLTHHQRLPQSPISVYPSQGASRWGGGPITVLRPLLAPISASTCSKRLVPSTPF